jgi:hypothetical protein
VRVSGNSSHTCCAPDAKYLSTLIGTATAGRLLTTREHLCNYCSQVNSEAATGTSCTRQRALLLRRGSDTLTRNFSP